MRLLNLHLKAIGPFTDVVLDLSAGNHGLHVIVGPNEAGKSSSLRALSYLFFGFPNVLSDDFLHKYDQLRVGATLLREDGTSLEVYRRKGLKNNLRAGDDSTIVKPEVLAQFLGNLDRESFHHRFGIDHARLRMAGEEIRTGNGQLGEILFAAGTGLAGLRQVQKGLQDRAGELFKPRGQNQRINAALSELRDAQTNLKEHFLPTEEWDKHSQALKLAEEKAQSLAVEIEASRRQRNRLDRLMNAGFHVARRRQLLGERELYGDAPRLREDFGKEARAAADALMVADRSIARARADIEGIDSQLVMTVPSPTVLAAAEEIESIQRQLGTVEKAASDRVTLNNYRKDKEHRARQILQEMGRPPDLELAGSAKLRADESKLIRALGQQYAQPRGQIDETRATIARQSELLDDSMQELAELPIPAGLSSLRQTLRAAQKVGDLDSRLTKARSELAKAEARLGLALSKLPAWSGTPEELRRLVTPSKETLDHFEVRFRAVERRRERSVDSLAKLNETIRGLEAQVKVIEQSGDVPLEADLEEARKSRDRGWRLVRGSWLGEQVDASRLAGYLEESGGDLSLAEAFEQSMRRVDQVGDRLRRESANVALKAGWLSDIARHRKEIQSLEQSLMESDRDWAAIESEWKGTIPIHDDSRHWSVSEIRAWLSERDDVVQLVEKVEEVREELEPIVTAHAASVQSLRLALGETGNSTASLAEAIERAEAEIQQADALAKRREQLEAAIKSAKTELANARRAQEAAEAKLEEWRKEWAPKMERIGLEPNANPLQAEDTLAKIQELEATLHELASFVSRIKGIDRDEAAFQSSLESLCERIGGDKLPAIESPYEHARELARILKRTQAVEVTRSGLLDQRRQEELQLRKAEEERDASLSILERLCREAGCDDPEKLSGLEERSRARARIDADLRECEEQLLAAAAGADLNTFAAEVESLDPDELSATHARLADATSILDEQLKELHRTIGAERAELARMDGRDDRAAHAAEKVQSIVAQLQGDVARFAAIRLSANVLQRAVERYREKTQGPVLARASGLFADLTGTSFSGLEVDDNGDGRMILKGVRPDGTRVGVEGMSDGSHDQLYLALRLASLETWLDTNEPIPLIVDDILMSFDDRRATAALRALAALARRTQVLFFTHHQHLAELAEGELAPDEVFIRQLPRRG